MRDIAHLKELLARHEKERAQRVLKAVRTAARKGRMVVKRAAPVAFGPLRESVEIEHTDKGARIVVESPYAAAVEVGSRPHWAPLAPLLAWIKLRGAQGLFSRHRLRRLRQPTTAGHAHRVAALLKGMEADDALDVSAPLVAARMLQRAIAKNGTRPTWFVRSTLPQLRALLATAVRAALHAKD